jgi:C1A family cysteine protease
MTDPIKIEGYGWKRQNPDWRDHTFAVPAAVALPRHFDLLDKMPAIWDQGRLGSCTAHGTLRAAVMAGMKEGHAGFMPSRLMQYWDSRYLEGTTLFDAGAMCRDAIKAVANWGMADESLWPYDISKFAQKPPAAAYAAGAAHKAIEYEAVAQSLYALKVAIFSGCAVVFGFSVYESFESQEVARTGLMPMPAGGYIGGHCVAAIGWNSRNYILCVNSWGDRWGDPDFPGCFWMPPDYITNSRLASDFWIIKSIQ